jgi:hypothetical protein
MRCRICNKPFDIIWKGGARKYCGEICARKSFLKQQREWSERRKEKEKKVFHWERISIPSPSKIYTCSCGRRYIKTRTGQRECLFCLSVLIPR